MREVVATSRLPIPLGKQGENKTTIVKFPVAGWAEIYGNGTFSLLHQRNGDSAAYPCVVTVSDNIVSWEVTNADVYNAGEGRVQLIYTVDDKIAKSVVFDTFVTPSLDAGSVPEPTPEWIENVFQSASDAEAWAVGKRNGVDVPSTDPTYHNNAKWVAENIAKEIYWVTDSDTYDTIKEAVNNGLLPMYKYNIKPTAGSSVVDQSNRIGIAVYTGEGYDYQAGASYMVLRDYYGIFPGFYSQYTIFGPLEQICIEFYKIISTSTRGITRRVFALYTDNISSSLRYLVTSRGVYNAINAVGTLLINKGLITQEEWNAR